MALHGGFGDSCSGRALCTQTMRLSYCFSDGTLYLSGSLLQNAIGLGYAFGAADHPAGTLLGHLSACVSAQPFADLDLASSVRLIC